MMADVGIQLIFNHNTQVRVDVRIDIFTPIKTHDHKIWEAVTSSWHTCIL